MLGCVLRGVQSDPGDRMLKTEKIWAILTGAPVELGVELAPDFD